MEKGNPRQTRTYTPLQQIFEDEYSQTRSTVCKASLSFLFSSRMYILSQSRKLHMEGEKSQTLTLFLNKQPRQSKQEFHPFIVCIALSCLPLLSFILFISFLLSLLFLYYTTSLCNDYMYANMHTHGKRQWRIYFCIKEEKSRAQEEVRKPLKEKRKPTLLYYVYSHTV